MRPQNNGKRGRSRGRNKSNHNQLNRTLESNGPDIKIRGSAAHIHEKYLTLARDAHSSGDRVGAENYLQHAEHYHRLMMAALPPGQTLPQQHGFNGDGDGQFDEGEDGLDAPEGLPSAYLPQQAGGGQPHGQYQQQREPREHQQRDYQQRDHQQRDSQPREHQQRDYQQRDAQQREHQPREAHDGQGQRDQPAREPRDHQAREPRGDRGERDQNREPNGMDRDRGRLNGRSRRVTDDRNGRAITTLDKDNQPSGIPGTAAPVAEQPGDDDGEVLA